MLLKAQINLWIIARWNFLLSLHFFPTTLTNVTLIMNISLIIYFSFVFLSHLFLLLGALYLCLCLSYEPEWLYLLNSKGKVLLFSSFVTHDLKITLEILFLFFCLQHVNYLSLRSGTDASMYLVAQFRFVMSVFTLV